VNLYPGINCAAHNQLCWNEHGENGDCDICPDDINAPYELYDFKSNPEGLVQDLTYLQARAFYDWKYHIKPLSKNSAPRVFTDYIPSEEQFKRIQKGETVVIESQTLKYPDPWFRYVIHVYKK
jgi:hypothetical protein